MLRTSLGIGRAVLKRVLITPIRWYQRFLSPLKPIPTCRYLPTCSSYAIEAIERRGVVIGCCKALWRLLRCNPLFPGGFDPVVPIPLAGTETGDRTSGSLQLDGRADCVHRKPPAGESLDIESVRI